MDEKIERDRNHIYQNFQSTTGADFKECVKFLEASEWDLGKALNEFYEAHGGDGISTIQQMLNDWKSRFAHLRKQYDDLMEEKSQFDPCLVNKLRNDLEAATTQQVSDKSLIDDNKMLSDEKLSLQKRLEELLNEVDSEKEEIVDWQQRYDDLKEQKSQSDPELVNKLKQELEAATAGRQISNGNLVDDNKRLTDENCLLKTQLETFSDENSHLKSDLSDMTERFESESVEKDRIGNILTQARQVARKYKLLSETQAKAITAHLETTEQKTKESEELKSELEKIKSTVPPGEKAKMQFLLDRLKYMEKKQKVREELTARTEEKLLEIAREKNLLNEENQTLRRQLEEVEPEKTKIAGENGEANSLNEENRKLRRQLEQIEAEKKIIAGEKDETERRLSFLSSMHNQCEPKYQELQNRLNTLQEEKSVIERQLTVSTSEVQPVSAMVLERPGSIFCQEPRTSTIRATRPFNATVASARALGTEQIVRRVPGPAQPDQSSSAGVPAQAYVAQSSSIPPAESSDSQFFKRPINTCSDIDAKRIRTSGQENSVASGSCVDESKDILVEIESLSGFKNVNDASRETVGRQTARRSRGRGRNGGNGRPT